MTLQVNIAEAKAKLSELVARAEAGEEIVLARAGKPIVTLKLVPATQKAKRVAGAWAHLGPLEDPDLFLRPDPELEEAAQSLDEDEFYKT
ncbi:MAG: type II toxin-antitoxin system prevent-host-death family antitoxin [Phenylobacterium sp.]|uniref:type II toxin-antitoxin system Phd/YefM family antitoxin n=1 Tax=Phenylobacterium sp. TaxID=1871053 RepID=UPI002733D816|nr:type II toxin-antitoxin system prevent-host-death family antitoxin [Phenylobacterium sp.]MDP3749165.1 type II toxin-antitoxin system prevent-host-death family antitoxin [Phenylobacterium sp.]